MDINKKKIKVGFIHNSSNVFLKGNYFDNNYYHFFMKAIRRHNDIEVVDIESDEILDVKNLKEKFDIILLWENSDYGMPKDIIGLEDLNIPVIAKVGDPNRAKSSIKLHKKWKINHYFHYFPEPLFHDFYPANFNYTTVRFGIEKKLYQNLKKFDERINDVILNSGAIGNRKFIGKIINSIRNPKWNALKYYYLRTICNDLNYVKYTHTLDHEYIGDKYPKLLEKYAAGIAATSLETTIKYWEIPAAGCLTFMEITDLNKGKYLGFIDGETSIFINKKNYKDKFQEFLSDKTNPKWKKIANAGQKYAIENFNNDKATETLVTLIKKYTI